MSKNIKSLFSLFQKLDYRDKDSSAKKKITGIIIGYLFANTLLSYNFFISFDERSYIILAFTSNLFLTALIVLTDFDNLFLSTRSVDVLRALPIESSSVFKAKFLSALSFLLIFILSSALPQMIFFYFIDNDLLKTIAYTLSNILFCYFAIGLLIFVYIFALNYFKSKATMVLNSLQILFFIFIFYSSTLSSRVASVSKDQFVRGNILSYPAVKYLPQNFYSNAVYSIFYFTVCLVLTLAVFCILYLVVSKNYYSLSDKIKTLGSERRISKRRWSFTWLKSVADKFYLTNNYEAAAFNLTENQLQHSKFLRVKYIPIIFMPLLFVIIGMLTDLPHLLFFTKDSSRSSFINTVIPLISPSITFTLIMCSRLLISNTKIADENSVSTQWIYDSLPLKEKGSMIRGTNKFIYVAFILPVVILIMILLSFRAEFSTVLLNILFIISGIYFINSVALLFDKTLPFTLESSRFNSASRFIEVFFAMFLGILLFLIQIFVFQNIIFVIISILIFIIISLLLNRN